MLYNTMEWERKFTSLVKETESNLERIQSKLGSADSGLINNSLFDGSAGAGQHPESITSQPNGWASFSLRSRPRSPSSSVCFQPDRSIARYNITPLPSNVMTTVTQNSVKAMSSHDMADSFSPDLRSTSFIAMLNERINAQNQTIEQLTRTLSQTDREREVYSRQLHLLKDEMSHLQQMVRSSSNNTVSQRADERGMEGMMEGWRKEIVNELSALRQQLDAVKHNGEQETRAVTVQSNEQYNKLNYTIQDVQRSVQSECRALKLELQNFSHRLAKLDADVSDIRLFRASDANRTLLYRPTSDSDTTPRKTVSFKPQQTRDVIGGRSSESLANERSPSSVHPISHLRDDYKVLQQKLMDLDRNFLRDSDDEDDISKTGRPMTSRGGAKSGAQEGTGKKGGDSSLASVSPSTSDIDVSMLTTEPITSSRFDDDNRIHKRQDAAAQLSDYIFTDDITTDVDDCLSFDDL